MEDVYNNGELISPAHQDCNATLIGALLHYTTYNFDEPQSRPKLEDFYTLLEIS